MNHASLVQIGKWENYCGYLGGADDNGGPPHLNVRSNDTNNEMDSCVMCGGALGEEGDSSDQMGIRICSDILII